MSTNETGSIRHQHYSDPSWASDPHVLPNIETFQEGTDWYWWPCFVGCLPDDGAFGPFDTEAEALADARDGIELDRSCDLWIGAASAALWANCLKDGPELETADLHSEECQRVAEDLSLWSPEALAVIDDVLDWFTANGPDIDAYMVATGRDLSHVGHDFSLSRAGHGTGLWDRGAGPVGDRLHAAAKVYGSGDLVVELDEHDDVTHVGAL